MGLRTSDSGHVGWYCSTVGEFFGPVFSSQDEADEFQAWVESAHGDVRDIRGDVLRDLYAQWKEQR